MATEEKKKTIGRVTLKEVTLSFCDLFVPGKPMKADDGSMQPGKFKSNGLMKKVGDPFMAQNKAAVAKAKEEVMRKAWGDDPKKWPKIKPNLMCLRDGDLEDWDGYEGSIYISASNQEQPALVHRKKDPDTGKLIVLTRANGGPKLLYAGAVANIIARLWAQKSKTLPNGSVIPNRINATLESVQFVRHGTPFSGATPVDPDAEFEELEDEDGDESDFDSEADGDDDEAGLI